MKLIDNLKNGKTTYEPYKYVMADTSNIYIGAKYTYEDLLESEDIGFKLKSIISHYILKESDPQTSLESELYFLTEDSFTYKTFEQLKIKIKTQVLTEKKSIFGKTSVAYKEKVYSLKELVSINLAKKKGMGMCIFEISVSKLALMSFTV